MKYAQPTRAEVSEGVKGFICEVCGQLITATNDKGPGIIARNGEPQHGKCADPADLAAHKAGQTINMDFSWESKDLTYLYRGVHSDRYYQYQSRHMQWFFGIYNGKLPFGPLPTKMIGNTLVRVVSRSTARAMNPKSTRPHRVLATCNYCGREIPFGKFQQHIAAHRRGRSNGKEIPCNTMAPLMLPCQTGCNKVTEHLATKDQPLCKVCLNKDSKRTIFQNQRCFNCRVPRYRCSC